MRQFLKTWNENTTHLKRTLLSSMSSLNVQQFCSTRQSKAKLGSTLCLLSVATEDFSSGSVLWPSSNSSGFWFNYFTSFSNLERLWTNEIRNFFETLYYKKYELQLFIIKIAPWIKETSDSVIFFVIRIFVKFRKHLARNHFDSAACRIPKNDKKRYLKLCNQVSILFKKSVS